MTLSNINRPASIINKLPSQTVKLDPKNSAKDQVEETILHVPQAK